MECGHSTSVLGIYAVAEAKSVIARRMVQWRTFRFRAHGTGADRSGVMDSRAKVDRRECRLKGENR